MSISDAPAVYDYKHSRRRRDMTGLHGHSLTIDSAWGSGGWRLKSDSLPSKQRPAFADWSQVSAQAVNTYSSVVE